MLQSCKEISCGARYNWFLAFYVIKQKFFVTELDTFESLFEEELLDCNIFSELANDTGSFEILNLIIL